MSRRVLAPLFFLLCHCSPSPTPVLPRSALGQFAREWLAMTAADSSGIARFAREHQGTLPFTPAQLDSVVADLRQFIGALGPLTPVRTIAATDTSLTVLLRSDKAGTWKGLFRPVRLPSHERVTVDVGPAQPQPELNAAVVELPLVRTPTGRPIIMVSVNGSAPLRFVIDIGTNVSIVTPDALRGILSPDAAAKVLDQGRFVYASLKVGGAIYRSGGMRVDDLGSELDGLLGLDMFADLLLTLDYPASRVRLTVDSLPHADGRETLDYTLPRPGSPTIRFTLDGKTYDGVLDVGSIVALEVPAPMVPQLRWQKPPVPGNRHSGPQLADARAQVGRVAGDVTIAGLTIREPIIEGMPGDEEILIGQPLLAAFSLTLDQAHQRVRLTLAGPSDVRPGPFELAGFRLKLAGAVRVASDVIPNTGAAAAGVVTGDTVTSINGTAVSAMSDQQIQTVLDTAESFRLEVVRGKMTRRLVFKRTRLVE